MHVAVDDVGHDADHHEPARGPALHLLVQLTKAVRLIFLMNLVEEVLSQYAERERETEAIDDLWIDHVLVSTFGCRTVSFRPTV